MVKNHSRKIKKKGGDKHHLGGETQIDDRIFIPKDIVRDNRSIYEDSQLKDPVIKEPVDHIPLPSEPVDVSSTDMVESKPTESDELQFQFTRHVMSCNNLDEGKWYSGGKDYEPGATAYGIEKTIEYARSEQNEFFNFNHVYVSNLYRTWITAVLLYGTNLTQSNILNLYISPHLKEYHGAMKRGNFPKEINHMANKFLKFLKTLKTLDDNAKSIGGSGNFHNNYTNSDYENHRSYEGTPLQSNRGNWDKALDRKNEIDAEFYRNLPNNIILHLPPTENSKGNDSQKITYTKDGVDEYKVQSFCDIQDTAGPNSGRGFIETGNLQDFMEWYNSKSNYYGTYNKEKKVHIVTHSHIMREYLARFQIDTNDSNKRELIRAMNNAEKIKFKTKLRYIINQSQANLKFDLDLLQYYDYDGDDKPGPIYPIRNSNCWHFITTKDKVLTNKSVNGAIEEFKIQAGVPIKKTEAKDMETNAANNSLCGNSGSVGPMSEKCSNDGGRKTRKRHIRRTKKRSKRKNNKSRKHHK